MIAGYVDERKRRLIAEAKTDVTGTSAQSLREGLSRIKKQHEPDTWNALYLDLRNARIIDSMGLNWLFNECRQVRDANKELVIRVASPAIQKVLEFARLDKVATVKYRRRRQTRP